MWIHLSKYPIHTIGPARRNGGLAKPPGLFFAKDNQWANWLKRQGSKIPKYRYALIRNNLNIYDLDKTNVNEFIDKYAITVNDIIIDFNWSLIRKSYDGIRIDYNSIIRLTDVRKYFIFSTYDVETLVVWKFQQAQIRIVKDIVLD